MAFKYSFFIFCQVKKSVIWIILIRPELCFLRLESLYFRRNWRLEDYRQLYSQTVFSHAVKIISTFSNINWTNTANAVRLYYGNTIPAVDTILRLIYQRTTSRIVFISSFERRAGLFLLSESEMAFAMSAAVMPK